MAEPTTNQRFHLLLADISMAMAIATLDRAFPRDAHLQDYAPGQLRDAWLAQTGEGELHRRVCAMANAGMGALQRMEADALQGQATRWGIPIDEGLAQHIAEHFEHRRTAVLRYRS